MNDQTTTNTASRAEGVNLTAEVEDDHCTDGDYMMDSDDCIQVAA